MVDFSGRGKKQRDDETTCIGKQGDCWLQTMDQQRSYGGASWPARDLGWLIGMIRSVSWLLRCVARSDWKVDAACSTTRYRHVRQEHDSLDPSFLSPPVVLDTNVLVAGACRRKGSSAYQVLMGVLDGAFPVIMTEPIALEYLGVLSRPRVRELTGLSRRECEELVADLISLSKKVQVRFSWRPNLQDEGDNKFVEAAIHTAAVIVTRNVSDFERSDLARHGWNVLTPPEFLARYH